MLSILMRVSLTIITKEGDSDDIIEPTMQSPGILHLQNGTLILVQALITIFAIKLQ
jgi:hypothetical protein